jgi:hypothetical protein
MLHNQWRPKFERLTSTSDPEEMKMSKNSLDFLEAGQFFEEVEIPKTKNSLKNEKMTQHWS